MIATFMDYLTVLILILAVFCIGAAFSNVLNEYLRHRAILKHCRRGITGRDWPK